MRENKFRVYYEYEIDGEIHNGIESEASWFLLTQSGELLQHGPLSPLRDCKEYKKLIPLFYTGLKDSKGVDIYEGDLIQYGKTTYEVRWNFVRWIMFDPELAGCDGFGMPLVGPSFSRNKMKDIEIIGNIWENGGLLNATNKTETD